MKSKKILAMLLTAAMLFAAGCTKAEEPAEPAEAAGTEDRAAEEAEGSGAGDAAVEPMADEYGAYNAKAEEAYLAAVQTFADMGTLPGSDVEIPTEGYGHDEWDNLYAICDLDEDGKLELLIRVADTIMASSQENVYTYNEETGEVEEALVAFPVCNYYDTHAIESGWSHGTGMETDDFWPFNAFVYDKENDSYYFYGSVSQYTLEILTLMEKADEFPADVDEDGNGVVYEIINGDDAPFYADDAIYQEWRSGVFGDNAPLDLPWTPIADLVHPNE
ncbi:MAG: hypothetical protein IKN20_03695 [Firmicutes bacterium]|nr:hypothetical protein [Bacillota bacterium]